MERGRFGRPRGGEDMQQMTTGRILTRVTAIRTVQYIRTAYYMGRSSYILFDRKKLLEFSGITINQTE